MAILQGPGAYSLVRQAIQLGLLPRLAIVHTSAEYSGQIYLPRVNTALLVGVMLLVGLFRTSSALASAYGIAVATTMVVDGLLAFFVFWKLWQWPLWKATAVMLPFVVVDVTFFFANALKLFEGAWAPLLLLIVALGLYPQLLFKMTDLPVTHLVHGLSRAL